MKLDKIYPAVLAIIIILTVAVAVLIPFREKRLKAQDAVTATALKELSSGIKGYAKTNGKLPRSVDDIDFSDTNSSYSYNTTGLAKDKSPLKNIEYKPIGDRQYQLCGNFKTDSGGQKNTGDVDSAVSSSSLLYDDYYYSSVSYTKHGKGNYCFNKESVTYTSSSANYGLYGDSSLYYGGGSTSSLAKLTPTPTNSATTTRDNKRSTDIKSMASMLEVYFAQKGYYPADCTELSKNDPASYVAPNAPSGTKSSCSTSMPSSTNDVYQYSPNSTKDSFTLKYWSENSKTVITKNSLSN